MFVVTTAATVYKEKVLFHERHHLEMELQTAGRWKGPAS